MASPTDITLSTSTLNEQSANGFVIGNLTGVDADGDATTFTLIDSAGGRFSIVGNQLRVADTSLIDFETATSHSITVRVTDTTLNDGTVQTFDKVLTITIVNVNDPTDLSLSATTIAENSENDTVVATITTTDPTAGDTFTYALTDDAGGRFKIVGDEVQVADHSLLDFEAATSHSITIRVTDGAGFTYTETFTINLTDVNPEGITGTSGDDTLIGGAADDTLAGLAGNDIMDGGAGADTMVGGDGDDTYFVDDVDDVVTEVSGEGTDLVRSSLSSYTLASGVENGQIELTTGATLTGNSLGNTLTGNTGDDVLLGGDGADSLVGGTGADTMQGGSGADTYVVDNAGDIVSGESGSDIDLVQSSVSFTLGSFLDNLTLTGTGNINGTGNNLGNVITGNSGANLIDGGTGVDTMAGGDGNDTYIVSQAGDTVTENASEGTDTVESTIDFTLGANIENLVLKGSAAIDGTGNGDANSITGNTGSNLIDGGAGADTMAGGGGADTYIVDDAGDVVTEAADAGIDLVRTSLTTYTLGDNVEKLELTSGSDSTGVGNALNNTLTGGAGNDSLDGSTGADSMIGGAGNDTYVIDSTGDRVVENASEGTDLISSSVTFSLAVHGANVENLTLTGTDNINATGNDLDNVITGNDGNNRLDGGDGTDTLAGGLGDDTYVLGTGDSINTVGETGGTDTIETSLSVTLASLAMIENITLTGTGDVNATGNAANNVIVGNSGDNLIDGDTGDDTMTGGAGDDTFVVDSANDVVNEANGTAGGTDEVRSSVTYSLATGTLISVENLTLTGSGNIDGTGNTADNDITGNSGNNRLDGGAGNDTLTGGGGNDTFVVDSASDSVVGGAGTDTVEASISYTISNAAIENLTLLGGTSINATGNSGANTLTGNTGRNLLDGDSGADTMIGGTGDDTYVVDNAGDVVTEDLSGGTADRVRMTANISYTLAENVEQLELTSAAGAASAIGNSGNNLLIGNSSANTLDGGAGRDTMQGGAGNDTYVVDDSNDVVTELAGEGTADQVNASVSYTLGANVDRLTLTGTSNIDGTGNGDGNVLTGNSGNNVLDGGAGIDTMIGGLGDDTYVISAAGETVTENAGEGTDTIRSAITFSLTSVSNIENLELSGTAEINATGNTGNNRLTGNSAANILDGGTGDDTMVGGDGNDTYVVDSSGDVVTEATGVNGGIDTVNSSVSFTLAAAVEHLTLTGSSAINGTGNEFSNRLAGNSAANLIDGKSGNDTMTGGDDNDTYVVSQLGDVVVEAGTVGAGANDLVRSWVSGYVLADNVEDMTLMGTGHLAGTGNGSANTITGNSGNNRIDGKAGNDTMIGGTGNDTYVVAQASDVVTEAASAGTDTVEFWVTRTAALYDNVENLVLKGTSALNGVGNTLANRLTGNTAANELDGGAGNDTMSGGKGNDTYIVDATGDVVVELTNEGTDEVRSSVTYSIFGQAIETLTLTGSGNINGTGSDGANTITGNSGNNKLDGKLGNDTMAGDAGNDTYVVAQSGDVVTENTGEGTDLVQAYVSYTLSNHVENMTLLGGSNINATGNSANNVLTGNGGKNRLDGDSGDDTMAGGGGDDTYVVNAAGDVVTETAAAGTDWIESSVANYTLANNVENMRLTGSSNINGTGNTLANRMEGNSGNNNINGGAGNDTILGGAGNDTLTGGAGNDVFVFNTALNATTNVDNLADFSVADDKIQLENAIFTAFTTTGVIDAAAFVKGAAATTTAHRIIVNGGDILYDADGSGAGAAVRIATMSAATATALTVNDFEII